MERQEGVCIINGRKMFLELFDQLQKIHETGYVLGNISTEMIVMDSSGDWHLVTGKNIHRTGRHLIFDNEYLYWKKQNLAPEYRDACLRGKKYYPTMAGDIYGMAYCIYEIIAGYKPKVNFQLNRNWAVALENAFACDTAKKRAALQSLMDQCTQVSEYFRIQTCEQLKNTEEFQILYEDYV